MKSIWIVYIKGVSSDLVFEVFSNEERAKEYVKIKSEYSSYFRNNYSRIEQEMIDIPEIMVDFYAVTHENGTVLLYSDLEYFDLQIAIRNRLFYKKIITFSIPYKENKEKTLESAWEEYHYLTKGDIDNCNIAELNTQE